MKTKKISATDISRFHGDQQLNKDGRMVGTYQQENGFYTRYSLNQQEAIASYLVRGSVSLFDPKTGQVLKVKDRSDTKADYLTQNQDVYKDARLSIMLNSNQAEDLRQAIAEKSQALCSKHMSLLLDSTAKSVPSEQMTLLVAIALFGNQYVQSRSKSAEAQHTRMLRLDRVANLIPQQKLGSLSLRVVKKACQELGDQWRKYVQEASSFVDYIFHLRRDASGHNAFQDYLERHPKEVKRNHQKAAKKAVKAYNELIQDSNIVRSMSRAGKPTDNPANEALNGSLTFLLHLKSKIPLRNAQNVTLDSVQSPQIHPCLRWRQPPFLLYGTPRGKSRFASPLPYVKLLIDHSVCSDRRTSPVGISRRFRLLSGNRRPFQN